MKHGSIIMIQRLNKSPYYGNTRSPYSQEISCARISPKYHDNSFLGLGRCSAFGIHATQDNHYWRYLYSHNAGFTWEYHGKLLAGVLLLHDNAPTHKSWTSQTAIKKCGFLELNHLPYRPGSRDYFLFRNLKKFLRERQFSNDNAVNEAVTGYFDTQDVSFFLKVFITRAKWTKCLTIKRYYIEK